MLSVDFIPVLGNVAEADCLDRTSPHIRNRLISLWIQFEGINRYAGDA